MRTALARARPDARLVDVADSYSLVPLNQRELLADLIAEFVAE